MADEKKTLLLKITEKIKNNIKLYVFDYDGTIFDINDKKFNHKKAFVLIKKVLLKNKYCFILTARCASFINLHFKNLKSLYKKNKNIKPILIGGGNGSILYKYTDKGLMTIYNNGLTFAEVKKIMSLGNKIYNKSQILITKLNKQGIDIHQSFLKKNWHRLIPDNFINENKLYKGICFAEEAKVAFVLPRDIKNHKEIIDLFKKTLNKNLKKKYSVVKGDHVFLQINHSFKTDTKLHALKIIMKKLSLNKNQVFVFANMPDGNDRGILIDSHLPFTFTNSKIKILNTKKSFPYYISSKAKSGVESMHVFINNLL